MIVQVRSKLIECGYSPVNYNIAMEKKTFADVSPTKNDNISIAMLVYQRVDFSLHL